MKKKIKAEIAENIKYVDNLDILVLIKTMINESIKIEKVNNAAF